MKLSRDDIETLIRETKRQSQLDMLNWFMKLCGAGQPVGMLRKHAHNKFIEISGEGEKA